MNIFRKTRAQYLSEWLEIATAKLSPDAKVRICTDIASHYYEAVDGHLENGSPMSDAQAAALAELGNAKAAARRFRRMYLTKSEIRTVAQLLKFARLHWVLHVGCWVLYWFFYWTLYRFDPVLFRNLWWNLLLVASGVFLFVFVILSARRNTTARILRSLVFMLSVMHLNLGIVLLDQFLNDHSVTAFLWFLCSFESLAFSLQYFRLAHKLGKVAEDWMAEAGEGRKEIPPEDPVAS